MNGERAYYGSIAENYNQDRIHESIWKKEQEYITSLVESFQPGCRILDIPTGTGRFLNIYASRKIHTTAADISEDMLKEARKTDISPEMLAFYIEDATKLSFADSSFDHIICWRLTHLLHPEQLEKMIIEFSRVARKKIILQFFYVNQKNSLRKRIISKISKLFSSLIKNRLPTGSPPTDDSSVPAPWDGIQTYAHTHENILSIAKKCNLQLDSLSYIEDASNPENIYAFKKIIT